MSYIGEFLKANIVVANAGTTFGSAAQNNDVTINGTLTVTGNVNYDESDLDSIQQIQFIPVPNTDENGIKIANQTSGDYLLHYTYPDEALIGGSERILTGQGPATDGGTGYAEQIDWLTSTSVAAVGGWSFLVDDADNASKDSSFTWNFHVADTLVSIEMKAGHIGGSGLTSVLFSNDVSISAVGTGVNVPFGANTPATRTTATEAIVLANVNTAIYNNFTFSFNGAVALALAAASTVPYGTRIRILKSGTAGAITITPAAGTIAGAATHTAIDAQADFAIFEADVVGNNWFLVTSIIA